MERLTQRRGGEVYYIGKHTKLPGMDCASTMRVAATRDAMQRLAEYEDSGVDPEVIAALSQHIIDVVPQIVEAIVSLAPQIAQKVQETIQQTPPEKIMELLQESLRKN